MTVRFVKTALVLLVVYGSADVLSAQRGQAGAACDKACLPEIADTYLAALVAHDTSKVPIAPNAKFTEQAQPMAIGEGQLWKLTTEGPTTFEIPVADPVVGQIGLIYGGKMHEIEAMGFTLPLYSKNGWSPFIK